MIVTDKDSKVTEKSDDVVTLTLKMEVTKMETVTDIDNCGGSDIDIVKDRNSENDSESDSVSERDNDGDF